MMCRDFDLAIIGAGLSGLIAAAKAAEMGKKVLLLAKGMGVVELSTGCIDLWGYCLEQPEEVCRRPVDEIARMVGINREHPYAKVQDVLEESMRFFQRVCSDNGCHYLENKGDNWLLPTAFGTVRPTYLVPASMAVRSLFKAKSVLVVGFKELKDFYPEMLVRNLKKSGEFDPGCHMKTAITGVGGGELTPNALASRLEQPDILTGVISRVRNFLSPGSLVLFPPVLGDRRDTGVALKLARGLECPVYEVSNIPPALPGQRLLKTLLHYLKVIGVEVIMGCKATGAEISGGHCLRLDAEGAGGSIKIRSRAFVLATGSFLGGGLEARPGYACETVFNLPVKAIEGNWWDKDFFNKDGHPFSKFGIVVNDRLQPVDGVGRVLVENLMVVGASLAGCNYPVEKCGGGVAVATGYKAGKLAGEVGR